MLAFLGCFIPHFSSYSFQVSMLSELQRRLIIINILLQCTSRKTGLKEGNAKCRHLKKWDFVEGVNLSEAQNPITPPPTHTHYIRVYSILIHLGKGGGGENQREG
jgi:hypothetical protein